MIDRYEQVLRRVLMGAETVGGAGAATAPVLPEGAVETGGRLRGDIGRRQTTTGRVG